MTATRNTVLSALVAKFQKYSRAIAGLLATLERATRRAKSPPPQLPTPKNLVAQCTASGKTREALKTLSADESSRLADLVLREWKDHVRPKRARRPDVVNLTCIALSNPEEPETLTVARFVGCLALRSMYGVPFQPESLTALQAEYRALSGRFSQQQRRRVRLKANNYERLLVDLLALDGSVYRSVPNPEGYFQTFLTHPLGINQRSQTREFGRRGRQLPELHGELPPFPTVLNSAFAQPLCVPGLDEVTGGLIPAVGADAVGTGSSSGGGQVTLIAGPPGSGKTTVCLAIASRLAELGSEVRYLTTEEDPRSLRLKRAMTGTDRYVARSFWPDACDEFTDDFAVVEGRDISALKEVVDQIRDDIARQAPAPSPDPIGTPVFLIFPRVLVIDSLPVLLHVESIGSDKRAARKEVGEQLRRLRELGVCVFLVGGAEERSDVGLAYLVDNVFLLALDQDRGSQHAVRTFTIEKTRLQTSHRGRHVFHLSRRDGFIVSPSVHSVMRIVSSRRFFRPDPEFRSEVCPSGIGFGRPVTLQARSHVLVYGHGSSGKARFAMSLALAPRFRAERLRAPSGDGGIAYSAVGAEGSRKVLVVSFLYPRGYYQDIFRELVEQKSVSWHGTGRGSPRNTGDYDKCFVDVLDFYPGFIDAESVLNKIRRKLDSARLEGRPFTAVVVDGIHNVILQYPLLERERMLWPVLYRLFRSEGLNSVSTFTFFEMWRADGNSEEKLVQIRAGASHNWTDSNTVSVSEEIFYHLLISSSDYTFVVEREAAEERRTNLMKIRVGASIDGFHGRPQSFRWDPRRFRAVIPRNSTGE